MLGVSYCYVYLICREFAHLPIYVHRKKTISLFVQQIVHHKQTVEFY
jgi:hypothetical protein